MVLCSEYIRQQANPVTARLAPEPMQAEHQVVWIYYGLREFGPGDDLNLSAIKGFSHTVVTIP